MRSKPRKPKRSGIGNRHSGREFGRQIDADLNESQEPVESQSATACAFGDKPSSNKYAGRQSIIPIEESTEFTGAEFPESSSPDTTPPPITPAVVRDRAVRLLAIREHGRKELEQKLLQRELPPDLIVSVLDQLAEEGLQCDARFAESYTRMRVGRGYGANKVRADLRARRLGQSVIEEAISDYAGDWIAVAGAALEKKFGGLSAPDAKARAKMQRFLYQRGFAAQEIRSAMHDYEIVESEL